MTTITTKRIEALKREAAEHGDVAMRIICDMAIDWRDSCYDDECLDADGLPDYSGGGHSASDLEAIRSALRMTREDARAECERVILEVEGQL